jgi:hypothetical protein
MQARLGLSVAPLQRELKFVFPNSRSRLLREWLDVRCRPDPQFAAGRIVSIYFDAAGGRLLDEKINSDYLKTKVRLRWYGDWTTGTPAGAVFLEVKQRIGSTRRKFRRVLDWTAGELDGLPLEDPRLLAVDRWVAEAGFRLAGPLRPAICLEYRRRRYLEAATGTRVCLDQDIAPLRIHGSSGRVARRPIPEGVFEVKGAAEQLPETLLPLIALGCRRQSFSKFERCMEQCIPAAPDTGVFPRKVAS